MAYKRIDGKKVAKGLLIAAALYYFGSLISGNFGEDAGGDGGDGGDSPDPSLLQTDGQDVSIQEPDTTTPAPGPESVPLPSTPAAPPVATTQNLQQPQQSAAAAPASTQPAPQPEQPQAAPQTPPPTASPKIGDEGIIGKTAKWFQNLSPGAQAVLGGTVAGGAGMTIQALAQKNAQEDAKAREDRAREDRTRRGQVQPFSLNAFRAKGA